MPSNRLKNCLDEHQVEYSSVFHVPAFTAQETAECTHIPGKEFAKTVMVTLDETEMVMVVLPAMLKVSMDKLARSLGVKSARLSTEDEFQRSFPECEIGAMPPFGNLYGLKVVIAKELAEGDEIAFNACTHTELVKLRYVDFDVLVRPQVVDCTQ